MTVDEVLALIKGCRVLLYNKINNDKNIKDLLKRKYTEAYKDAENDINDLMQMNEKDEYDQKRIQHLALKYRDLYKEISPAKEKNNPKTKNNVLGGKENVPALPSHGPNNDQDKNNNIKWLYILAAFGAGVITALLLSYIIKQASLNATNNIENEALDDQNNLDSEIQIEEINAIKGLDINDETALTAYAALLSSQIPEECNITVEQIENAIKLANLEMLDDRSIHFSSREDVYQSTNDIGVITNYLPTDEIVQKNENADMYVYEYQMKDMLKNVCQDKLTLADFELAKCEEGYDLYALAEICIKGLNEESENNYLYAKFFNDLVARLSINYTICNGENGKEDLLSHHYVIMGMYNAHKDRILALTSKLGYAIYGDSYRIEEDGSYGNICVEEIINFQTIGNEDNALNTYLIDELILNPDLAKQTR